MFKKSLYRFIAVGLIVTSLIPSTPVSAKSKYYYINCTVRNYRQQLIYNDGTGYYSEGAELTDTDGNIWIYEDIYNEYPDGSTVSVKVNTHGTNTVFDDTISKITGK